MKTWAAVLEQQNAPLQILELTIPPLKKGQVLVQIAYSGVCQAQLNEIRGHKGPDAYLPHTLGHEASGVVLEVGSHVTKVRPGDRVVASWLKGSGAEESSTVYEYQGKSVQSGAVSTFLEKAIISENRLIPIPASMPLKEAALLGCAIPTGAGAVFNEMRLEEGQSIAVFGVGGIGLSAILAAKHKKAHPIIAIDVVEEKLQKAISLGATHTINPKTGDVLRQVRDIAGKQGVDFALESAGRKDSMELAFQVVKAPKGLAVIAGNVPVGQNISIDPFDLIRGKRLIGTWGGGSQIDRDVSYYVSLFQEKAMPIGALISHEVQLSQINELMHLLEQGKVLRGIVSFEGSVR